MLDTQIAHHQPFHTTVTLRVALALVLCFLAPVLYAQLPSPAVPTAAVAEDASRTDAVEVDGLRFDSWSSHLGSDYFRVSGLRCGTPDRVTRQQLYPFKGGDPSDCSSGSTNPTPDYDPTVLYEIPVVVHILMDTACAQGVISDAMVDSQIDILNEDLLALTGTNGGDGTDGQISFALASQDPGGAPTNGITRDCNTTWFNDSGSYWNTLAWDPHRYLNIYTNQAGGNLGYVPFLPSDAGGSLVGSAEDRVVILWSSFGRNGPIGPPYDQGRTSTHEVGHYLGLEHTFNPQSSCGSATPPGCYSDGDLICDTNVEQNPGSSPCHVGASSSCGSVDPTDNYMDYSDDLCMERFTLEQIRRTRCSLEHYRPNLYAVGGGNTAPQVTITAPADGSSFPEGTSIAFAGSATDAEDGNLTAGLAWSSSLDGSIGTGGGFSTTLSVGSHTVTAAVTDSGGLQGSAAITVTVTGSGNTAPAVSITAPSDGASFPEGTSIAFAGSATDAEDGNLTAGLAWSSSLDGSIGAGGGFSTVLSVGSHTVTAAVTDSGGLQGSATISVTVTATCGGGGGLDENFEGGAGAWTAGSLWHLVSDSGCASPSYSSPVKAMYYGQDPSCDYDTGNATSGDLTSPQISGLTASSNLTFDYFRQVEDEPSDSYDQTEVAASVVGSATWTTLWSRDSTDASENAWTSSGAISLAAYEGQSIQLRFRFDSVDEISNDFTGWLIDDVVVTGDCDDNTAPQVTITSPAGGAFFLEGTPIVFAGSATDAEDGSLTAGLAWSSNLDGSIGSGGSFAATLSVGSHTVTAAVTDSGGLQGSATISVTVTVEVQELIFSDGFESGDLGAWSPGG